MAAILVAFLTWNFSHAAHSPCLSALQGWLLSSAMLHVSTFVIPQIAWGSGGDLVAELSFPFKIEASSSFEPLVTVLWSSFSCLVWTSLAQAGFGHERHQWEGVVARAISIHNLICLPWICLEDGESEPWSAMPEPCSKTSTYPSPKHPSASSSHPAHWVLSAQKPLRWDTEDKAGGKGWVFAVGRGGLRGVAYWTVAREGWEDLWPAYTTRLPKLMEEGWQLSCSKEETIVYLWPSLSLLSVPLLFPLGPIREQGWSSEALSQE